MTSAAEANAWPIGKVGVVALVGRPNVGKSTLLNRLLDYHLAAVSPLPQTTRRHWRGIYSDADSQVVLVDTPGAHLGKTHLSHGMLASVRRAIADADIALCIGDPTRAHGEEDAMVADHVREKAKAAVVILNKADIATPEALAASRAWFAPRLRPATPVLTLSAATGEGVPALLDWLKQQLPRGPFLYPADQLTDAVERDIAAELIREAALTMFREEVPHALAVQVDQWKEGPKHTVVHATIFVERAGQRAIILGHGGETIGGLRSAAIKTLCAVFERRFKLSLFVKVAGDWRDRPAFLRDLGLLE